MVYIDSLDDQLSILLQAFGFGFILGFLYDVFRCLRIILSNGRKGFYIADIIYFIVCTVLNFFMCLVINDGKVRVYSLFGETAGWLVYYFTLGIVVMKLSNAAARAVKKINIRFENKVLVPFRNKVFRFFKKSRSATIKRSKKSKKIIRNSKIYLKSIRGMLYNLYRVFCLRKTSKKERKE